jgi:hypothetical protein
MAAIPVFNAVANPCEPAALLIVATVPTLELQVTDVVRFRVLLSEKVPVAVNCWVTSSAIEGAEGVTARETSVAEVTVRPVEPLTLPKVAVMVVEPTAKPLANPWLPATLLMLATVAALELHSTAVVTSCVLPSVYVPTAL